MCRGLVHTTKLLYFSDNLEDAPIIVMALKILFSDIPAVFSDCSDLLEDRADHKSDIQQVWIVLARYEQSARCFSEDTVMLFVTCSQSESE